MKLITDGITLIGEPNEIEEWIKKYPSPTILAVYRLNK